MYKITPMAQRNVTVTTLIALMEKIIKQRVEGKHEYLIASDAAASASSKSSSESSNVMAWLIRWGQFICILTTQMAYRARLLQIHPGGMGLLSTKTMVVTPTMMRNLQPRQDYMLVYRPATIEINGQVFRLSRDGGDVVEKAITRAIERQDSITVSYRESDNLITQVMRHDKSL
jgi:hypothetical protein